MLRKIYPVALVIGMLIGGFSIRASAQNDDIVLTLIVAQFQEEIFTDELLGEFQAANPGVKVIVKTAGNNGFFAPASVDSEGHLDEIETYVTSGDVLLMNSFGLSVEATRAGYFLDLSPLVNADPSLNSTDFYPAVWQSVQWDNGIWAIPAGVDVYVISYDPAAFDEAGLAYPDPAWTMDDYINAIKTLTEYDDSGAVTRPGFISNFEAGFNYLLRGFLGTGVYDPAALPGMPDFSSPQLESLLQTWYDEIDKEGVTDFTGSFDFNEIPIRVDRSFGLASFNAEDVRAGALLPGGIAGLNVDSFAVSSGTAYPEQAYALAKWLTTRPEFTQRLFGARPARQSMVGMESSGGGGPQVFRNFTPEIEALIDEALIHAIPVSDMRFMDYVIRAMDTMGENGGDARSALQEMEQTAITNLQTAEQRNQDTTVF
ncbi:MAG TPA: extracellular solute-binding protein, partial [Aggregatilineales bacterium]|nr:extracellular solute-binding protein [Aggregatilineales bacterium]